MSSNNIVYSTENGDMRKGPEKKKKKTAPLQSVKNDGVVRVRRESRGRGGKVVSVITGMPLSGDGLNSFASELKRSLGTGGSVTGREIVIQGDRTDAVIKYISDRGYPVKKSGG